MSKNTIGYIIIIALLVITSVFSLNLFLRERSQRDLIDIRTFPQAIGDWQGRDLPITEREYKILETRNLIARDYINPSGEHISLFIIYSETNRSVFHPPEVCLIGSGVEITDKKIEKINYDKLQFSVNKMYLEKNNYKDLALYCYKAGNLYTSNYFLQQAYFALSQFFGKRVQGATIRVSMPIKASEQETFATLRAFLKESIRILNSLN